MRFYRSKLSNEDAVTVPFLFEVVKGQRQGLPADGARLPRDGLHSESGDNQIKQWILD